jgi:hypothetical protein
MSAVKTPCAVSREEFRRGAKPLPVKIGDVPLVATPKEFSTGSFGWNLNGQTVVMVGGVPVKVQIGLNLIVANSREAATAPVPASASAA